MAKDYRQNFDISRDEFNNISKCLEKEEFRKLFVEYCTELKNPENRKQYEKELKQLEEERGYDVKFITPEPGYVIKTSVDGKIKAFINVAKSDIIQKPTSELSTLESGVKGLSWSIPYSQAHPRKDYDNKKVECIVYDVVFSPDSLHLASKNANFKKILSNTALDAVQNSFNVKLDLNNLKYPKLAFKGTPTATVTREKNQNFETAKDDKYLHDIIPNFSPASESHALTSEYLKTEIVTPETQDLEYAVPNYKIVHRRDVQYHEMTHEVDAKIDATIPKELVITFDLPLLESTEQLILKVTNNVIHLVSEKLAKYKIELKLPYVIDEKNGSAKFNKESKQLIITVPVIKRHNIEVRDINHVVKDDSGVDSGSSSPTMDNNENGKTQKVPELQTGLIKYIFPKFTANKIDKTVAFTIHVKNIDPSSNVVDVSSDSVQLTFSSSGAGHCPFYYSFYVRFPNASISYATADVWDNNLIFHVETSSDNTSKYLAGLNKNSDLMEYDIMEKISDRMMAKSIEDDSLCIEVQSLKRNDNALRIEIKKNEATNHQLDQHESMVSNVSGCTNKQSDSDASEMHMVQKKIKRTSRRKNKKRSLSESCCDELKVISENEVYKTVMLNVGDTKSNTENTTPRKSRSVSESNSEDHVSALLKIRKYKSILKQSSFNRSISECSSIDDTPYSTSVDTGVGSVDQGDNAELSESCKKSVRFNDVIKKQIFRSDSSILAQKRKNQKKKESKKRSLSRRFSEGESTDNDEKEQSSILNLSESSEHDKEEGNQSSAHDSGIDFTADPLLISKEDGHEHVTDITQPINIRNINQRNNKKSKSGNLNSNSKENVCKTMDIEFKSGMIFDIEM